MSESQKRLAALKQQSRMTARSQQDMKADLAAFQARLQASKLARAAAAEDGATTSTDAATKAAQEQEVCTFWLSGQAARVIQLSASCKSASRLPPQACNNYGWLMEQTMQ